MSIQTKAATKEYRANWDVIYGSRHSKFDVRKTAARLNEYEFITKWTNFMPPEDVLITSSPEELSTFFSEVLKTNCKHADKFVEECFRFLLGQKYERWHEFVDIDPQWECYMSFM